MNTRAASIRVVPTGTSKVMTHAGLASSTTDSSVADGEMSGSCEDAQFQSEIEKRFDRHRTPPPYLPPPLVDHYYGPFPHKATNPLESRTWRKLYPHSHEGRVGNHLGESHLQYTPKPLLRVIDRLYCECDALAHLTIEAAPFDVREIEPRCAVTHLKVFYNLVFVFSSIYPSSVEHVLTTPSVLLNTGPTSRAQQFLCAAKHTLSEVQSARAKADLPFPPTETRGLSPLTLTGMNEHHLSAQSMLVNPASVIVQNAAVSVAPLSAIPYGIVQVRRRYCETTHLDCVASKWGSPSKSGLYLTYDP
uniref:Uncharacterized protein n=1 Tax=Timema genevievae TaxID=629358 RepID=A0A7R9PHU6_TIMGE|nr:unnamed protein product [Timema genevievae]